MKKIKNFGETKTEILPIEEAKEIIKIFIEMIKKRNN